MTAPTPNQLRALADDLERGSGRYRSEVIADAIAALRSASDRLEAVQATIDLYRGDNDIEAHWLVGRLDVALSTGGEAVGHV